MSDARIRVESGFQQALALIGCERTRFAAQAAFARELAARDPARGTEWDRLTDEASALVAEAARGGGAAHVREAVREAERLMAPIGAAAKAYTVYCVGHAHIDMNWMWSYPETVSVTVDSITTVLRLMQEVAQFRFSQSQGSVYEMLERYRPDLLEQVQARVREGRWEVTASHWVETDKNMAGGESLCRHLLTTRRYMQRLFGLRPEDVPVEWSPDTFGHAATVPTYLTQGGIRFVYMHRPGVHGPRGNQTPSAFWWEAPDGSRVLVRNDMALGYNGVIGPQMVPRSLVPFLRESGLGFSMFVYGVGDHGGGPTRRDLANLLDMTSWPVYPTLVFATARQFFERLEAEGGRLPVLEGELNFEFTGCYTAQSLIKKANRFAEKRLAGAEAACVLAERLAAVPYPAGGLEQAWRNTLFNHFHDILPGSGVHDTRTFAHGLYQQAMALTATAETRALRAIADLVDTRDAGGAAGGGRIALPAGLTPTGAGSGAGHGSADGAGSGYAADAAGLHPFVVFNTTQAAREEIAEAVIWDPGAGWESPEALDFEVEGPDGTRAAAQVIERGTYWGHRFQRIAFAAGLPGLGYGRWLVRERPASAVTLLTEAAQPSQAGEAPARQGGFAHPCRYAVYERGPEGLENEHLRLEVDPQRGGIRKLVHLPSGTVLVEGAASILEHAIERPRPMSAWEIEHTGPSAQPLVTAIERLSTGPLVASIAVTLRVAQSEARLVYELRAGDPRLHLRLSVTWLERGGAQSGTPVLRLVLPLAFAGEQAGPRAVYEIPFGAIERRLPNGEEVPALRWAAVEAGPAGRRVSVLLLNDCKHGHSFHKGSLALTLIRSSFAPDPLPEIGQHDVRCGLLCVAGPLDAAAAATAASAFERELQVVSTAVHGGRLPHRAALLTVEGAVLGGLKGAEEGGGIVVRLYNPGDREAEARIVPADLLGRLRGAEEVDLLERRLAEGRASGGAVTVRVPPRGIRTLRIDLD